MAAVVAPRLEVVGDARRSSKPRSSASSENSSSGRAELLAGRLVAVAHVRGRIGSRRCARSPSCPSSRSGAPSSGWAARSRSALGWPRRWPPTCSRRSAACAGSTAWSWSRPSRRPRAQRARRRRAGRATTRARPGSRRPPRSACGGAARGAERVLLVPGDCPTLDPGEVDALLARHRAGGDRARPPRRRHERAPAHAAGRARARRSATGSFARHAARGRAARGQGRASCASLGLDVDTPERPRRAARRAGRPLRRRAAHPRAARAARPRVIEAAALPGLPEVRAGDDLGALLAAAADGRRRARSRRRARRRPQGGLQGRGPRRRARRRRRPARAPARSRPTHGKDPRHVEVILGEAAELRARRRAGGSSAAPTTASCARTPASTRPTPALPTRSCCCRGDPDASARALRAALPGRPGGRDHRLVRPRVAPRASARSRSAAPDSPRSTTGAAGPTAPAASCTPR